MKFKLLLVVLTLFIINELTGQGTVYVLKGGLTLATQRWNNFERGQPLWKPHGAIAIESLSETNTSSLYFQAGYHSRGRVTRYRRYINSNGQEFPARSDQFILNNIAAIIAAKKKFPVGSGDSNGYYGFGIRGEYNISSDLGYQQGFESAINKFVYGVTVVTGVEFPLGELIGGMLEFSIHPDLSNQLYVPPQPNYPNPYTGQITTLREQKVVNLSLEVSVGIRFIRKVEYID